MIAFGQAKSNTCQTLVLKDHWNKQYKLINTKRSKLTNQSLASDKSWDFDINLKKVTHNGDLQPQLYFLLFFWFFSGQDSWDWLSDFCIQARAQDDKQVLSRLY